MKPREQRIRVILPARMRWDGRWVAATACNISSRGLMIRSTSLPPRGAFVEIELLSVSIAARAVWTKGPHCGLQARERLNVAVFTAQGRTPAGSVPQAMAAATAKPSAPAWAEAGRGFSSVLQFASIAAAAAITAAAIGWQLYDTLAAPATAIAASIAGG